jgi:hypothetical protein
MEKERAKEACSEQGATSSDARFSDPVCRCSLNVDRFSFTAARCTLIEAQ